MADIYLWQVAEPPLAYIQSWDDESVLYDPRTGETHLLSLFAAALLNLMFSQTGAVSTDELGRSLSAAIELDRGAQFDQAMAESLGQFQALGLIEGAQV